MVELHGLFLEFFWDNDLAILGEEVVSFVSMFEGFCAVRSRMFVDVVLERVVTLLLKL
jgi:hypothetical protein